MKIMILRSPSVKPPSVIKIISGEKGKGPLTELCELFYQPGSVQLGAYEGNIISPVCHGVPSLAGW